MHCAQFTIFHISVLQYSQCASDTSRSFLLTTALSWSVLPLVASATPSIISQYSSVTQPYATFYGSNLPLNDPRYLVATGTMSSLVIPLAYYRAFSATDTFSFKLINYYYGQTLDCQTQAKTADEWGMTRIPKDPYAPMVTIGPFVGTQCNISAGAELFGGGPLGRVLFALRNGTTDGYLGIMGTNAQRNFTVYGADIPPLLRPTRAPSPELAPPTSSSSPASRRVACMKTCRARAACARRSSGSPRATRTPRGSRTTRAERASTPAYM